LLSHPLDILRRVSETPDAVALIAVTDINGGTLRSKGALMAVTPDRSFGYISAGCVDGDIAFQARESLKDGQIRHLTYGEGSELMASIVQAAKARNPAQLNLPGFEHSYAPRLTLRVAGRGAPFSAMARLAHAAGFEVHGQSPDADLKDDCFFRFDHLKDPGQIHDCFSDPWSAVIFLFHDHDWEPALLTQALDGESFYIGAMGSQRTHAIRLERLRQNGVANLERIKGPVGLIPAMRDADKLAVSILAEIIDTAQSKGLLS